MDNIRWTLLPNGNSVVATSCLIEDANRTLHKSLLYVGGADGRYLVAQTKELYGDDAQKALLQLIEFRNQIQESLHQEDGGDLNLLDLFDRLEDEKDLLLLNQSLKR